MDKNQILRLLASVAATFMLTACGISMKPDHPQVYDSFKERRPPKENVFVESGTYTDQPQQRKSHFTPYSGPVSDGKNTSTPESPGTPDLNDIKTPTQLGTPAAKAPDITTPNPTTEEQRSFWERLRNKFSALSTSMEPVAMAERKAPAHNHLMLASALEEEPIAQGSTGGYSYYDMADEIIVASPTEDIKVNNLILAYNNSSASLVDVPEPAPYTDLKQEGEKLDKQDLKDVPQKPKKKADQPEVKAKPTKIEKPKQARDDISELTQESDSLVMAEAGDYTIQDSRAELVYTSDGQKIVTGTIGVIRSRAN